MPDSQLRRNRAFAALWAGQSVNGLGSYVSVVALPLLAVDRLHASTLVIGLIEAVEWIPAAVIGLPVGVFVDRSHRRRQIMMAANLGQAAALGSVPVTAAAGVLSVPTLLIAAVATGFFGVFFQTAYSPYLTSIVPADQLASANGRLQGSQAVAQISGPTIGGALVQFVGAANAILGDAVSFLVSLSCLSLVHTTEPARLDPPLRAMRAEIRAGLRYLRGDVLLLTIVIATAGTNLLLTAIGAVEIVFLVRNVGVHPASIGVLIGCSGAGGLVGAFLAGPIDRWFGTPTVASAALAFTAPFALLLPLAHSGPTLVLFAVGAFMVSFGIALVSVSFLSLRQAICPPDLLGRVSASSRMLMSVTIPIGALAGGALGQVIGNRMTILVLGVSYTVMGFALSLSPLRSAPELRTASARSKQLQSG